MSTATPPDTRSGVRRPRLPSERRVTSCTVDLGAAWYAPKPSRASGTASGAVCSKHSSSEEERAPPSKVRRPERKPEAREGVGTYQPAPVEDDQLVGVHNNIGLTTEVDVDLEIECEDLNVDLNTWDVRTDSP